MPRKRVAEPIDVPVETSDKPDHPISGFRRIPRPLATRGKWHLDNEIRELIAAADEGQGLEYDIAKPEDLRKIHMHMRHITAMKGYKFTFRKVGARKLQAWVERVKALNGKETK